MISFLRGTVFAAAGSVVVLEVGGVGYQVNVTPAFALSCRVDHPAFVHTALIVREDAFTLYGFATAEELSVFHLLLGVSGVGPKAALGVLSTLAPDEIAHAVHTDDDAAFRRVAGVGPKTAKLICVSLAGKLSVASSPSQAAVPVGTVGDSVLAALTGLGWSERIASDALERAVADASDTERASVPTLLRRTLAMLGPGGAR